MPRERRLLFLALALIAAISPGSAIPHAALAQSTTASTTIVVNAETLVPRARIFVSPSAQTVLEGSTFDVSVYLDTEQNSANTIDVELRFPPDKLAIVNPSGGTSLIQVWLRPPTYSNQTGDAQYTGIVPNGVVTGSGLITTITFKALAAGQADITISPQSSVLANDGYGTPMATEFGQASYTITPQPPNGVVVSSPTHPFPSQWYNNPNPVFTWQQDPGVTGFSYVLDNEPYTIPGDTPNTTGTTAAYENLGDGLWYFHIKAQKLGIWGGTTNFLARIDTQPPAVFTPAADIISGSPQDKALISFFTTDALSGIDHYEVAVVDADAAPVASPVFVQAESPYQLIIPGPGSYHVIVRAFDQAGNVRDASLDITVATPVLQFLEDHDVEIMAGLLALILLLLILHYFFGHKLLRRVHRAIVAVEEESKREKLEEAEEVIAEENGGPPPSPTPSPLPPSEEDQGKP